jgi:hypothetical protein
MNSAILPTMLNPARLRRRLVLGAALVAALVVWMPPKSTPALAQPGTHAAEQSAAEALRGMQIAAKVEFDARIRSDSDADKPADPAAGAPVEAPAAGAPDTPPAANADGTKPSVTIEKHGKKVQIFGLQADREYDSFNDLVRDEPLLGVLIFFSVALVFLVPLLLALAVIWYKVHKNRMLNETMLKLAEKGVVPPSDAIGALGGDGTRGAAPYVAGGVVYEQARQIRRRTAWSDLRKGMVMGAIGAAFTLAGIVNDGEASGIGLVLLFVGIGYIVLWWFEDRDARKMLPPSGGSAGSGP